MLNFLQRFLPFMIPMLLSMFIYAKMDKEDSLTKKISSHIKGREEWKAFKCACLMFLIIIILSILNIYVINIPEYIYAIICGITAGILASIANKLNSRIKIQR